MSHPSWKTQVQEIFGSQEIPEVTPQNLETFRDHLRSNLEDPCFLFLTSEEGAHFEAVLLVDCLEDVDESDGIFVQVTRTSDDKHFTLPLAQLECPPEDAANHQLVDAYCSWFIRSVFHNLWST
ncbi:MAG: hypothetical protein U5L00_02770 [Desulfovermiculus sp.]|nr:hypothetical protein [Desulfovermiculus sp.]